MNVLHKGSLAWALLVLLLLLFLVLVAMVTETTRHFFNLKEAKCVLVEQGSSLLGLLGNGVCQEFGLFQPLAWSAIISRHYAQTLLPCVCVALLSSEQPSWIETLYVFMFYWDSQWCLGLAQLLSPDRLGQQWNPTIHYTCVWVWNGVCVSRRVTSEPWRAGRRRRKRRTRRRRRRGASLTTLPFSCRYQSPHTAGRSLQHTHTSLCHSIILALFMPRPWIFSFSPHYSIPQQSLFLHKLQVL